MSLVPDRLSRLLVVLLVLGGAGGPALAVGQRPGPKPIGADPVVDRTLEASNPAQGMRATFAPGGVEVAGPGWRQHFVLEAWGRGDALVDVAGAVPRAGGQRVEYVRGALTEWYENRARGLEQGFTIAAAPDGCGARGRLRLVLLVRGGEDGLEPEVLPGGRAARFVDRSGETALHYTGLRAWDATGRELAAALSASDGRLSIEIDDGGAAYPLQVDPWISTEVAELCPDEVTAEAEFGYAVALSGDTALVGAPEDGRGVAYVFERDQGGSGAWGLTAELGASIWSDFGSSVAVSGDTAVVGMPAQGYFHTGSAFVFERDQGGAGSWGQVAVLIGSDVQNKEEFGNSVAISADTIVVGAWRHYVSPLGNEVGAAYVFERDQGGAGAWGEVTKLQAKSPFAYDWFGYSVAAWGDTILVGAPQAEGVMDETTLNTFGPDPGLAYVFERDQGGTGAWTEVARLLASENKWYAAFGASVAISGDTAVVGAPHKLFSSYGGGKGAAYVFVRAPGGHTWAEVARLTASDGVAGDEFGHSVAISGDTIVVGAWQDSHAGGYKAGSAYVFRRDQGGAEVWGEIVKLTAGAAGGGDAFGSSVAVGTDTVMVGASLHDADFTPGETVRGLALDPGTGTLYGADVHGDELVTIDPATGEGTPAGPLGFANVTGLAFDSVDGVLYGVDNASDQLITVDTATGAGTAVGPLGFSKVSGLAFDPAGRTLYGADNLSGQLVSIDASTGAATAIGPMGFPQVWGLAFDPASSTLFGISEPLVGSVQLITIDPSTGAGSGAGLVGNAFDDIRGLAWDPGAGGLLYTSEASTNQLVHIDASTGAGTAVGGLLLDVGSVHAFAISFETETYCTAGTSASGCQALLSSAGTASATAVSGFDLVATGVEGTQDGLFYFGLSGRQVQPWGNGTSYQCVAPPVYRAGHLDGVGTAGACDGWFSQDLNALWCPSCPRPLLDPGAGAVVQAQLWYRDPLSTSNQTTSLSDAIEFLVGP